MKIYYTECEAPGHQERDDYVDALRYAIYAMQHPRPKASFFRRVWLKIQAWYREALERIGNSFDFH